MNALAALLREVRTCTVCAAALPLGPRPIVQAGTRARILIIGQAPGRAVHMSGVPWDDPSGERLRDWTGIASTTFYDPDRVALLPMGLCYPGVSPGGGDAPPRRECAPLWHAPIRALLPNVRLTLLVGRFSQAAYLGRGRTMTALVADIAGAPPGLLALPHPAWRATGWMRRNPWFEADVLPVLRSRVAGGLAD